MNKLIPVKTKEEVVQLAKGLIILAIVIAHSIVFLSSNTSLSIYPFSNYLDLVAFTGLLFFAGITNYFAYLRNYDAALQTTASDQQKIFKRLLKFAGGYYLIAIAQFLPELFSGSLDQKISLLFEILVLKRVGNYAEFMLTFILFGIILLLFKRQLIWIIKSWRRVLLVAFASFFLGNYLAGLSYPQEVQNYLAILFGSPNLFRYPLLQYWPIFLIGLKIGEIRQFYFGKELVGFYQNVLILVLASVTLLGISLLIWPEGLIRWPPNLSFLLVGLINAVVVYLVLGYVIQYIQSGIKSFLSFLGDKIFILYVVNVLILYLSQFMFGFRSTDSLQVGLGILVITIISLIPLVLIDRFSNATKKPN